jgi:hypothetical protein
MRASEILRQIADVIDRVEGGQPAMAPQAQPVASVTVVDKEPEIAKLLPTNQEPQSAQDGATMTSPLQQELEIMKKAAGIQSAFDGQKQ